ncbi:hypothetical protein BJF88_04945 [Cellulosimicrobium sp. CUA-896]|nr:hypothetical protein BJF88_04945 [Cellulosimicrobium sp. CUA-896]
MLQTVGLVGTIVIALGVGVWAYVLPREFYDHFPSLLGEWISQDGPYNEHLIRDHGAQYLALGAASVAALFWRSQPLYRVLGIAWGSFGVLHVAYHVTHLGHMSTTDAVAQMVVLTVAAVLGIMIAVPPRTREPQEDHALRA